MSNNVRTDINSMISVGSIIHNNVFIGSDAQVSRKVYPDTRIMKGKQSLIFFKNITWEAFIIKTYHVFTESNYVGHRKIQAV